MKKYLGYYVAAGLLLLSGAITLLARRHRQLLDAFYPYVTRWLQTALSRISGRVSFPLWQVLLIGLTAALVAILVALIRKKRNLVRFFGWVLAAVCLLRCGHVAIYGLNQYAGPLAQDLRLQVQAVTREDLEAAAQYFQAEAGRLAAQMPRDDSGQISPQSFSRLTRQAAAGFEQLTLQGYAVFSGSTQPVKALLFPRLFSALQTEGVIVPLTGEAAADPTLPQLALPFALCRQMARRMCIAPSEDAAFAAFLACISNSDIRFQYSGYATAYRLCGSALAKEDPAALQQLHPQSDPRLQQDLAVFHPVFPTEQTRGVTLLVSWYLQQTRLQEAPPENKFDPTDKNYISGILGDTNE